jgi:hypothetical protein
MQKSGVSPDPVYHYNNLVVMGKCLKKQVSLAFLFYGID